jgi:hypothetical protein
MFWPDAASVLLLTDVARGKGRIRLFGAKALVAVLAAALLIPAAGATPGDGNGKGHGSPASVSVGSGAETNEPPPQAARGQAKRAENAVRKAERQAAREAARADASTGTTRVNPARACKAEREEMGDEAFAGEYGVNENGANAFGKCVSEKAQEQGEVDSGGESAVPEDETDAAASTSEASALAQALASVRVVAESMRELL